MFEWNNFKIRIIQYTENTFEECQLSYSQEEIEQGVNILFNIICRDLSYFRLKGFRTQMEDALTKTLKTEKGEVNPLRNLSNLFDSYLKIILTILGTYSYNDYKDDTFVPLIKKLRKTTFDGIKNYKTQGETWKFSCPQKYILYNAVVPRNENTHNAPNWDDANVMVYVKYCIAAYVFVAMIMRADLENMDPLISQEKKLYETSDSYEDIAAYDFMKYSRVSGELKKDLIKCYILRILATDGQLSESEIKTRVESFIGTATLKAVTYGLKGLENNGKILIIDKIRKIYELSDVERKKLEGYAKDCAINKDQFIKDLSKILEGTKLESIQERVLSEFRSYIRYRFSQASNIVDNVEEKDISTETNPFLDFLFSETQDWEESKRIFKLIIALCNSNDIIYRIEVGSYVSGLASSATEKNALDIIPRDVYLDTQVILPILCVINEDFDPGEGLYYKVASDLINISNKKKAYKFKFSKTYIPEVVKHVENALYLADVIDNSNVHHISSRNVFYNHYQDLKNNEILPVDIQNFFDYLSAIFSVYQEDSIDSYSSYLKYTLPQIIEQILREEAQITLAPLPYYESEERKLAENIFSDVMRKEGINKSSGTLSHDVSMGIFLFEQESVPRPFFITRDHSFVQFRSTYASKRKRTCTYFWQLFTPISFINSIDLLEMNIDSTKLSEELLLQLDDGPKETAKYFADISCRLAETPSLSSAKKRERNKLNYELFLGKKYTDITTEDLNIADLMAESISRLWDLVLKYMTKKYSGQRGKGIEIFTDDEKYENLIKILKEYIGQNHTNESELNAKLEDLLNKGEEDKDL